MPNKIRAIKNWDFVSDIVHKGTVSGYKFIELFAVLDSPQKSRTREHEEIQVLWAFTWNGRIYTVHDWKTHDRLYTLAENETWMIDSNGNCEAFIKYLLNLLEANRN